MNAKIIYVSLSLQSADKLFLKSAYVHRLPTTGTVAHYRQTTRHSSIETYVKDTFRRTDRPTDRPHKNRGIYGIPTIHKMASALSSYQSQTIHILTTDARCFRGTLVGYDQVQNLILQNTTEYIQGDGEDAVEVLPLGLYVLRGDMVAVIGDSGLSEDGKQVDVTVTGYREMHGVRHEVLE